MTHSIFQKKTTLIVIILLFNACATYKPQYKTTNNNESFPDKEIAHSFYLIGDGGNSPLGTTTETLKAFKTELNNASKKSTAIFLGDNIYQKGLPKKSNEKRKFAEHQLNVQTGITKAFKGKTIFIPGNHDWYSGGVEGLKRQENYIEDLIGKNTFLPENGCPIENIHISDTIELILIDSHWYMANWDKNPTINDDCDIKTRDGFLAEYNSLIKKSRGKTTIVALHHPMYTNGSHGGQFSFGSHMKPLPVLGTLKNVIRRTSGITNVDLQNSRYHELKKRLVTISQENKKVVFVSGHEHNLQYLVEDNLHQIVSGSASKVNPVRNIGGGEFAYATSGYARLDIFNDGSSYVRFYDTDKNEIAFETNVLQPDKKKVSTAYPKSFPKEKMTSVYSKSETDKSNTYKFLWGDRYRKQFSTNVNAPTVNLDTLYGGLFPVRKGGGNQSKSLRLKDKNGAQYVMRSLRKNAIQYLQAILFKDQYIEGQFDDTKTEDLLMDVFAGSHPYAPLAIGTLSDAAGIYHTNPVLYYVPKQNALDHFNSEFGNEMYLIEEHTSEGHSDLASFGFQDKIISTDDVMKKIHKDEDIVIDEPAYIKARLFDMLIGDWDRHQDQWRWIEFKENGKKVYRPLPRDRDQAFSKMSDGFLLSAAVALMPTARLLRKYDGDLVDVKGMNIEPYPLDMELIQESNKLIWDAQVKILQEGISDDVVEKAFLNLPKEILDDDVEEIKENLKSRIKNLQAISDRYYEVVNKYAIIKGTNKDDWIDIERMSGGNTKVTAYRIKKGKKAAVFHDRVYNSEDTKEIWVYSLDDDDTFHVYGNENTAIKIRLIGGQNNDTYHIENGKKIKLYDYKSKPNTIVTNKGKKKLTDNYETNVYNYKKLKNNTNQLIPTLGSNPDDGFKIGLSNTLTNYGFERNPFTSQHIVSAAYYFATKGYELKYSGEFANVVGNVNFGLAIEFNGPNYATNFFGYGNSTPNPEADDGSNFDLDFNRVKIEKLKISTSLVWRGKLGSNFKFGVLYERNEVEETQGRFINQFIGNNAETEDTFYGVDAKYQFVNKDNDAFPTLGMQFSLEMGYKNNIDSDKGFGYIIPEIGFDYKLVPSGQLVLATLVRAHANLGDDFEFYQGATIGAHNGLRGYRNERFTGKSAFVQSTDIRWNFSDLKTGLFPIHIGIYGGVDYGRIWIDDNLQLDSNYNLNDWNTSIGGGIFVNMADMMTANVSAFNSDDGLRLAFKLGFGL